MIKDSERYAEKPQSQNKLYRGPVKQDFKLLALKHLNTHPYAQNRKLEVWNLQKYTSTVTQTQD